MVVRCMASGKGRGWLWRTAYGIWHRAELVMVYCVWYLANGRVGNGVRCMASGIGRVVNGVPHIASGIGGVGFGVWSMASGMGQSGL